MRNWGARGSGPGGRATGFKLLPDCRRFLDLCPQPDRPRGLRKREWQGRDPGDSKPAVHPLQEPRRNESGAADADSIARIRLAVTNTVAIRAYRPNWPPPHFEGSCLGSVAEWPALAADRSLKGPAINHVGHKSCYRQKSP
jgi:hypothetical protein